MSNDQVAPGPEERDALLERGIQIARAMETEVFKVVYGPELRSLVDILIMAVFADGHVVVRAPVGLAKTLTCSALARTIGGSYRKKQFRPDMLPSEISGNMMYNQRAQEYEVKHGPLHGTNIFLADEITRGSPKAQSAFLEAMEERSLSIGNDEFPLEPLFMVLATRNPMEHEGVFQLPEAQLDRFLAQAIIRNISEDTAMKVLGDPDYWRQPKARLERVSPVTTPSELLKVREAVFTHVHVEERLRRYVVRLVAGTWEHELVNYGSSPRGGIFLQKAATIAAFRAGRDYVTPEDVQRYAVDVLAHRVFLKPEVRFDPNAKSPAKVVREVMDVIKFD